MRNWFRTKVLNFLYPDESKYDSIMPATRATATLKNSNDVDLDEGLRFTVLPARGGTIVQLRSYDHKTDRSLNSTHVIPDGENIAEAIGHIVSMELIRA